MNKPLARSLSFDSMFAVAATAWPVETPLVRREAFNGGYTVDDLDIDNGDAFIGAADEVLMRNLFDAVYEALHAFAADHDRVRPVDLADTVRPRFERRLHAIMAEAENGDWRPSDHALIRRYFDANTQAA